MKAENQRFAPAGGTVVAVALGILLSSAAFRCPGPDPMEAPSTGGAGGSTTESASSSESSSASSTSSTTSSATATVASSSSGCSPNLMTDPQNCGACGRACSPLGTMKVSCNMGVCNSTCLPGLYNIKMPPAPDPDDGCEAHVHHVFVTSMPVSSSMNAMPGGAMAGDAICASVAMVAGKPGMWMAWLSDDTTSPALRFHQDGAPYVRMDMGPIADNWMALTSGMLTNAINLDENGMPVSTGTQVWTGTGIDGKVTKPLNPLNQMPATNCINWSSTVADADIGIFGNAWSMDGSWTSTTPAMPNCYGSVMNHLYCFEQ